jgi:hypothetical protein
VGEGNPTEIFNYDYTSLTAGFNVWPTRTASKYNDYGNDSGSGLPGGACTGAGCNPPTTSFFPATSAAVGFSCAGCAVSVPLTLSDYHGYGLLSTSAYFNAATDGANIGANLPAIDAAQILNQYPGFFPDVPEYELTVTIVGSGSALSADGFITCPTQCSYDYTANANTVLQATPSGGYLFAGWSGACSGVGTCNLTMNQAQTVAATFVPSSSASGIAIVPGTGGVVINGGVFKP